MTFRHALLLSAAVGACSAWSSAAFAQTAPTPAPAPQAGAVGEVIVTAERRSENLQKTPVAVTAVNTATLGQQKIYNGADLSTIVPNMAFQPGLYGKPDFAIRGIGYVLVTSTGDPGVAVNENDAPISAPRIAEADFFDISDIEVLRGPQGTLYGKNATGGVINLITAKPTSNYASSFTVEAGNYDHARVTGYVNLPLGDMFALRVAGDWSEHSGYQQNVFNNTSVDGQNTYSTRVTLSFKPNDRFSAYAMYEHFGEDDSGGGNGSVVTNACTTDPGPTSVGGVTVLNPGIKALMSFGCSINANIYAPGALGGSLYSTGTFGGRLITLLGLGSPDVFATNPTLSRYQVNLSQNPFNRTANDLGQISLQWNMSNNLTLSSLTTYDRDSSQYGAGGLPASMPFAGGFTITDPQISNGATLPYYTSGTFNSLNTQDYSEEIRLQSSFKGPWNFTAGAIYMSTNRFDDVFVYDNVNSFVGENVVGLPGDPNGATTANGGHEYFQSVNPYNYQSAAIFGEVYWNITPELKFTGGLRYTYDYKVFDANTSAANLLSPFGGPPGGLGSYGYIFLTPSVFTSSTPTGRAILQWTPKLSFTDSTMFYVSYSRGYKPGGFNPPNLPGAIPQQNYGAETVDAFEIGTKNVALNHTLTLDLDAFFYNYQGYQSTQAASFGTLTTNVNAQIWGVEFESVWKPVPDMTLNAQVGYLGTRIMNGPNADDLINPYNPTDGDPEFTAVKTLENFCLTNTAALANLISTVQGSPLGAGYFANTPVATGICPGSATQLAWPHIFDGLTTAEINGGIPSSIVGNRLPFVPDWTIAAGAQYDFHVPGQWIISPRVDVHYTGGQFSDLFNTPGLYVKPYAYVNLSLMITKPDAKFNVQFYVKNLGDQGAITGAAPGGGAITASQTTVILSNPTTYGVSVTKSF